MVESTIIMKKPTIIANNVFQGLRDGGGLTVSDRHRSGKRAAADGKRPVSAPRVVAMAFP
ncbi:hypothetical protein [Mycobacterium simiae]|uniref:hypothetical protein n=1 Tax=Mycobacterium simiae TaxID=1784 RepID=UPI0020CB2A2C|nr:hypothetical protein [Mycobacterium simiae]